MERGSDVTWPTAVTFRRTTGQRAVDLVWPTGLLGLVLLTGGASGAVALVALLSLLLIGGITLYRWRRDRVTLDEDGIRVVAGFRDRSLPWSAVQRIADGTFFGNRTVSITATRRFVQLPAPCSGPFWPLRNDTYERDVATIRGLWIAYRGADFAAPPPPNT